MWRREREPDTVDWRSIDPHGAAFSRVAEVQTSLFHAAVAITSALGLTMSVQDWLEQSDGDSFLEVNPQGAFLFLPGARELIVPALVAHLCAVEREVAGVWPRALKRFAFDFRSSHHAPCNDGVVPPVFVRPGWIEEVARHPGILELASRARDEAVTSARTAEEKASRFAQTSLALLTISLALGTFQLSFSVDRGGLLFLLLLTPVCAAIVFLSLAAVEAIEIDRVGVYRDPKPQDLVGIGQGDPNATILAVEVEGRRRALWTSERKHSDLMQARAWFSRGLAFLLLAGLVAAYCKAQMTSMDSMTAVICRDCEAASDVTQWTQSTPTSQTSTTP